MNLRLRIVSDQRRSLGDRSSLVLGPAGCTIGRSAGNDWVLPDPLRYVSARHARIEFRNGHYYLEDVSTNGSYVNDAEQPVGGQPHQLRNGDLLRLGDYHIVVALESETGRAETTNGAGAEGVPTSINRLQSVARVAQTDLGAQLDVNDLLVFEDPTADSAPHAVAGSPSLLNDEPSDSGIARRIARLAKAVNRSARGNANLPALYDVQTGLEAFCRGAGIATEQLPPDAQTRLMHLIGQLLRELLVGLKDLDRSRSTIRNRFRIDLPVAVDDPRPSLTKLAVEDLILALLSQHETRQTDAVQWLREAMGDVTEHETAVAKSMRSAFVEFLDRLDPAELEARFERAARRGKSKGSDRAQYWELYTEFYRNLIEMPADHLPHTFVEAFATAYKSMIRKPQ